MDFSDYLIDPKNYTSPMKKYFKDIFNYLSSNNALNYVVQFGNLYFTTDKGILLQDFYTEEKVTISNILTSYSFNQKDIISIVTIEGYHFGVLFNRHYSKIQDLLTRIGGTVKALTLSAYMINYLFSKAFYIIDNFKTYHLYEIKKENCINDSQHNLNNNIHISSNISKNLIFNRIEMKRNENIKKIENIFESEIKMFKDYWFSSGIKSSNLRDKEYLIENSLNVETITKMYFYMEIFKLIFFNSECSKKIEKNYRDLFITENEIFVHLRQKMINPIFILMILLRNKI